MRTFQFLAWVVVLSGCGSQHRPIVHPERTPRDRLRFNQLALRANLPLFWAEDSNQNGAPDPLEVRSLRFYPSAPRWVENGAFTDAFREALSAIDREANAGRADDRRQELVRAELDHAAPTLIETRLSEFDPVHRAFATRMLEVGEGVDRLYARQVGMEALSDRIAPGDAASAALFRRNWGPGCLGATTEQERECSALEGTPHQPVDVYPASLQSSGDSAFCAALEARPNASDLLSPFTVVREREGELIAVSYSDAYRELITPIVQRLRAAADAMTDPNEAALIEYLRAAATSFETNDWNPADEAWSRMNARNSAWYVRVGPDETYWDPCSRKAGFHMSFARINQGSLVWQDRLSPLRTEMENTLATLVPDSYRAREVSFGLPDFIDIVTNHGDDRDAFGATIGQSLPNWGPVSEQGRGRTVAMSNLYTDPDSVERRRAQAATLLDAASMRAFTGEQALLPTILHEATHNLGPSHEYRAGGRTDDECFGGGLASMLEELKAQSGGLFFVELLREHEILDQAAVAQAYTDAIVWAFGHISRGMYTPSGQRKAYSQLAAIQVGFLLDQGALTWNENARSAAGTEGAFTIDLERMPAAARALMQRVMQVKATCDRTDAEALAAMYVDGPRVPQATIVERYRAFPQVTFVYSVNE